VSARVVSSRGRSTPGHDGGGSRQVDSGQNVGDRAPGVEAPEPSGACISSLMFADARTLEPKARTRSRGRAGPRSGMRRGRVRHRTGPFLMPTQIATDPGG
jgi:hypothetical protein